MKTKKNSIKTVLVTGGAGFIGSHVVNILLKEGLAVRVLDKLGPPTHDGTPPKWLNKEAELIIGDVRKKKDWRKALKGVDAVVHLASYMDYHLDFSTYISTNIESVALMFEVIVEDKLPIQKIIAASSQSVYGHGKCMCPKHGEVYVSAREEADLSKGMWHQKCSLCGRVVEPLEEFEDDTLSPQTPYGISKLTSEHLLKNLGSRYGVPVIMLRFSIALGPHQTFRHFYSGALRSFAVDALAGVPIRMNEDGEQLRDLVDVRDVASAHLAVLKSPDANFRSFNVGGGAGTKIANLARIVSDTVGVPHDPDASGRYRAGDARYQLMNVDALKRLGWTPTHTLEDSVRDYVTWIRAFDGLKEILDNVYERMYKEGTLRGGRPS